MVKLEYVVEEGYHGRIIELRQEVLDFALKMEKGLKEFEEENRNGWGKRNINPYESPEINQKTVLRLFNLECKHKKEFKAGEIGYKERLEGKMDFRWQDCKECVCAYIPYLVAENILRDVCFAVWHAEINTPKTPEG